MSESILDTLYLLVLLPKRPQKRLVLLLLLNKSLKSFVCTDTDKLQPHFTKKQELSEKWWENCAIWFWSTLHIWYLLRLMAFQPLRSLKNKEDGGLVNLMVILRYVCLLVYKNILERRKYLIYFQKNYEMNLGWK